MIPTKVKRNAGVVGKAEVRVLNDSLRVIFADGDTYVVSKEGWDRPTGSYNITLTKTNDAILFASPPGRPEPYLAKFQEFGNRSGRTDTHPGIPETKIEPASQGINKQSGKPYYIPEKLIASVKWVVVEKGPYEGMTIPYKIPYIFEVYPGTSLAMLAGTRGQNKQVEDFLRATGMDFANDEIPFAVNILPWLEPRLQAAKKYVNLILNEKGFIDSYAPIPTFLINPSLLADGENSNGSEAKTTKKAPAKKKSAAKKKVK